MLGQLDHTQAIARVCFGAGVLVMLAALVWGATLLRLQYQKFLLSKAG